MSTTMNEADNNDKYILPIEVLCVTCKQPIKGWVNSPQWLRVEWISPSGECRACDQQAKENDNVVNSDAG